MTPAEYQEHLRQDKIRIGHDPIGWAVQPSSWFDFDPDGVVYCADIDTAYRVARDQTRFGDQDIWKMTRKNPIKWVRVTAGEVVHSA